jgi:16S rRNA (cytidine1402-2'-O)-methyltransferase
LRGTVEEVRTTIADRTLKGEIVVVIGKGVSVQATVETMEDALRAALASLSVKDAAAQVAADLGLKKRDVYQAALKLELDE